MTHVSSAWRCWLNVFPVTATLLTSYLYSLKYMNLYSCWHIFCSESGRSHYVYQTVHASHPWRYTLFLRAFYFCFDPWLVTTPICDIFQDVMLYIDQWILHSWVRASWIKFTNFPTRCDCIQFCWHPSSGTRRTVITASGTGQLGLLPSTLVELATTILSRCWVGYYHPLSLLSWLLPSTLVELATTTRPRCWIGYYHPLSLLSWLLPSALVVELATTIRSRCWVPTQQRERMVADPVDQCQKL